MVTDELLASRLEAIEVVEEGIGGTVLDDAGSTRGCTACPPSRAR